ncbi:hypothetical protein LX36DRAFT_663894 [Colletotrichum falcatum]|nr:hypothetical protein LX36DRAFT_663894 [Colletotrichum falcatum]
MLQRSVSGLLHAGSGCRLSGGQSRDTVFPGEWNNLKNSFLARSLYLSLSSLSHSLETCLAPTVQAWCGLELRDMGTEQRLSRVDPS